MTRTLSLAIFSNGTKPAHWSIWIPTNGQDQIGKVIHVTGNPATGFFLEFKRNYDFGKEDRRYQVLALASVSDQHITDTPQAEVVDTTARDRVESVATAVKPPGRSANPFDPAALNCQNWIVDFVEKLIAENFIAVDSRTMLQNAPKRM